MKIPEIKKRKKATFKVVFVETYKRVKTLEIPISEDCKSPVKEAQRKFLWMDKETGGEMLWSELEYSGTEQVLYRENERGERLKIG
ncbi:MAG: hypothetical protein WC309_03750 [Candidatus Paceibacterota bacterium]|jgi:hypothetical protein